MEHVNLPEVDRKLGYWQYVLSKVEHDILKMRSKRADIQQKITYLSVLRRQLPQ